MPREANGPKEQEQKPGGKKKDIEKYIPPGNLLRCRLHYTPEAKLCRALTSLPFIVTTASLLTITLCIRFLYLHGAIDTTAAILLLLLITLIAMFSLPTIVDCYFYARAIQITPMIYAIRRNNITWKLHMSPLAYCIYESAEDPSRFIKHELAMAVLAIVRNIDPAKLSKVKVEFETWLFRSGQISGTGITGSRMSKFTSVHNAIGAFFLSAKTGKNLFGWKAPDFRILSSDWYNFSLAGEQVIEIADAEEFEVRSSEVRASHQPRYKNKKHYKVPEEHKNPQD